MNIKNEGFSIAIGDEKSIYTVEAGKWKGFTEQNDGTSKKVTLDFVAYVPDPIFNLFLIIQTLRKGASLSNKGEYIIIRKGNIKVIFDQVANSKMNSL